MKALICLFKGHMWFSVTPYNICGRCGSYHRQRPTPWDYEEWGDANA